LLDRLPETRPNDASGIEAAKRILTLIVGLI
jgi:hypothetical protein